MIIHRRTFSAVAALLLALGLAVGLPPERAGAQEGGTELGIGMYPRAIRLQSSGAANGRILVAVNVGGVKTAVIRESRDGGRTFTEVGHIGDDLVAADGGMCCGTLYELPRAVDGMPAGTLLWAASVGSRRDTMAIRVYRSQDQGRTWTRMSDVVSGFPRPGGSGGTGETGVWEPEFTVGAGGDLVVFYSEEFQKDHQNIIKKRLSGGAWGERGVILSPNSGRGRQPGMPVVRRLPGGRYFMVYEMCNGDERCGLFSQTSPDGWDWGTDPDAAGTEIVSGAGRTLAGTPGLAWSPSTDPDGVLLVVGKVLRNADGTIAKNAGSGTTVFASPQNGSGRWHEMRAPVGVPLSWQPHPDLNGDGEPDGDPCPNYSSALLPASDGLSLFEVATARRNDDPLQPCVAYTGTGGILRVAPAGTTHVPVSGGAREPGQAFLHKAQQHVFARNTAGGLRHWFLTPGGDVNRDTWTSGVVGAPVAVALDETQHAFARTTDGRLKHSSWHPVTGRADELLGSGIAGDPAAIVYGNDLHAFAVDGSGALQHWSWDPENGLRQDTWGQGVRGRPAVLAYGNSLHAFARGQDGRLRHWWWNATDGVRGETWSVSARTMGSDPAAVTLGSQLNVFAVDDTGHLRRWHRRPTDTAVMEGQWGPNFTVAGRPTALVSGAALDELHVFVRASAGGRVEHWWRQDVDNAPVPHDTWGEGVVSDPTAMRIGDETCLFGTDTAGVLRSWCRTQGDGGVEGFRNWGG
ncbi:hypothetical protein [Thermomonospora umbrina]|uniref:Repeat uncharacterized protein DUF346 n=1 Tax=Thermomonospora umbrina TaxID=111806 RepID=A0A3D9SPZ2_9ACTN|nr:hypothetical protein [Thermomonospora umbrina]REE96540.1 repeat uncharacterized protein DUF346 [Thermomonospora umbrina]